MLWSLVKVLVFVALVAALALGGAALAESGAVLRFTLAGWEVTLEPVQAVVALLVALAALWLVARIAGLAVALIRLAAGDETALRRHFDRSRERKGYQALADAMLALASGEPRTALVRVGRAERYLRQPELTTLLAAQAAEMAGDHARAASAWRKLLGDPRTRFVAVRGLLRQALAEGDRATALQLAEKAHALKPSDPATLDMLMDLQSGQADWKGARETLAAKLRAGALPRDVWRRRDAVLALQEARGVLDEGATIEAREAAIEANRQSPDLIPAAALAARALAARGEGKAAARVLRKAWEAQPHPDLAAAFAAIEPEETPSARIRRFEALARANPGHGETRLTMAELHLAAEDFPGARRALGDLPTRHPTQRALAVMAAIERGEGAGEEVVRGWLARALTAPRGPQWCCDRCQAVHSGWAPVCTNCGGFDTLAWREPAEQAGASATGAELLPLLVGEKAAAETPPAADG